MSCLPSDALSHFEHRERELAAANEQLERQQAQILADAASAAQGAVDSAAGSIQGDRGGTLGASGSRALQPGAGLQDVTRDLQEQSPQAQGGSRGSSPSSPQSSRPPIGADFALHATIKSQNARITKLQEEFDKARVELSGRDARVQELQQQNQALQDQLRALQQQKDRAERRCEEMTGKVSTTEAAMEELRREKADLLKEKAEIEVKLSRSLADCSAKDTRLSHLEEECERSRVALKAAGNHSKDQGASDRREIERLQGEVRKLERQRSELVSAFKKQMKLIEVLKRQRAHMEAARVLSYTEEEFIRVLELGDRLGEAR